MDPCSSLMSKQNAVLMPGDMPATPEQTAAAEAGQLPLLDVQETADKFKSWRSEDRLRYIQQLESRAPQSKLAQPGAQLPPNVQPSQLQLKLCSGGNRLSQCLLPTCNPDGLTLRHQPATGSSSSIPNSINWQFGLQLLNASHVGPTGFGSAVQPVRHVARCCIFDRQNNRFLGNIHTLPASDARPHKGLGSSGSYWVWSNAGPVSSSPPATDGPLADMHHQQHPLLDPIPPGELVGSSSGSSTGGIGAAVAAAGEALAEAVGNSWTDDSLGGLGAANACIVRCSELSADPVSGVRKLDGERLSLYVELNVAFRLVAEDAEAVPQEEAKGAGLVDELTTCWAMISIKRCAELVRDMCVSVPLYTGSIYQPVLLSALWAEHRRHHPVRSVFSKPPSPLLTFKAGPLPTWPPPLLPYKLMPSVLVARRDEAYLLATARLALEQRLMADSAKAPAVTGDAAASRPGADAVLHTGVQERAQAQPASTPGASDASAVSEACCSMAGTALAGFGDAALAALPKLLDDPVLLRELVAKWNARVRGLQLAAEAEAKTLQVDCLLSTGCASTTGCSSVVPGPCHPSKQQLLAALRASVLEVAPLLHCSSLAPAHISNFLEHQAHRAAVAERFCRGGVGADGAELVMEGCSGAAIKLRGVSLGRHPVDALSRATGEFVHQPFDVAETRVCVADWLAASRWTRC